MERIVLYIWLNVIFFLNFSCSCNAQEKCLRFCKKAEDKKVNQYYKQVDATMSKAKSLIDYIILRDDGSNITSNVSIHFTNKYYKGAYACYPCVVITKEFFQKQILDLGYKSDINNLSEIEIETIVYGSLSHEYAHILAQSIYSEKPAHSNLLETTIMQEYHADFICGFLAAKVLWDTLKKRCQTQHDVLTILMNMLDEDPNVIAAVRNDFNALFDCLMNQIAPYRHVAILNHTLKSRTHGDPEERIKLFNLGIAYAILDGVGKYSPKSNIEESIIKQLKIKILEPLLIQQFGLRKEDIAYRQIKLGQLWIIGIKYISK